MRIIFFSIAFLLLCNINQAQNITIRGYVKDAKTGEPLLFANCIDTLSQIGVTANSSGFYSLSTKKNKVVLLVSYLGYENSLTNIILVKDTLINIELVPVSKEINEVIVNGYTPIREQVLMGKTMVPIKTIKAMPSFVGEPDLMKAISYIPGISTGKEGYSNIYVRGGDRGQNLILLDGMKLYNTNHVGGFLSLFNSDVIKRVDVYKGGFPARYGGRASSIIDIYTKEGNTKEFKGKFNIGLLNSGIMIEGPLKENISYFFAARTSYYDLFTISDRREYNQTGKGEYFGYTFFDINGKISWNISERNKLSLSIFTGHDYQKSVEALDYSAQITDNVDKLNIHNTGVSLMQNYIVNNKMYLKNTLAFSNYNNKMESVMNTFDYGSTIQEQNSSLSKINDFTFNSRLEIIPNNMHRIKIGFEASVYSFVPSLQNAFYENENADIKLDTTIGFTSNLLSIESSIYIEDEVSLTKNIKINFGIRGTVYDCKDTTYYRFEPRVSFRWLMTKKLAFKMNYTILNQYNHVLINNIGGFEKEIWLSATKELAPQKAKQFSLGLFYGNDLKDFNISIEGFYKQMSNLLEYRSPVDEEENINNIENIIAKQGKGEAYGLEFQAIKEFNKVSVNFNYTLAWSNRKFEELNNGAWYPFIYDRRHDFSFIGMWQINKKYSFNTNFVLSTGTPVTLPIGYSKNDAYFYSYYVFDEINNRRLPLYHRLDVSLVKKGKTKKGNDKQFSINIFNVYARQNPVYVYYDSNTGKIYQKSLFSIIPTISYSVKF